MKNYGFCTSVKIVHIESGEALGPHETGELWMQGPQGMKGYYNNPKAAKDTLTADGWVKSGAVEFIHFTLLD